MGLIGGAIKNKINKMESGASFFTLLLVGLLLIFIKAYIVQISYNNIVEKITGNTYKLTFMDALFLVILFMGLI